MPQSSTRPHPAFQTGQGMTEYLIIVAVVAVMVVGAFSFLGQSIRGATAGLALEIAGKKADDGISAATKAANEAKTAAGTKATLDKYNVNNH